MPSIAIEFQPRDLWVGLYWTRSLDGGGYLDTTLYVCVVPMFPIVLRFSRYHDLGAETWVRGKDGQPRRLC